tara:strand:+ start:290 stop:988 length:699 start_codon:yes stop_codon:yes gene_type:complete
MKIKKAIILGAGFGKRMYPITNKIPKPLIKINGVSLLEYSIKFLISLGVKHIVINAHYLHKDIVNFIKRNKFSSKINVIIEKGKILNTGGGVFNASRKFKNQIFYVINPDTIWTKAYKKEFKKLVRSYMKNKKSTMLLVSKNKSFDTSFKGDFCLNSNNQITRQKKNEFIFTGAQIIRRSIFKKRKIEPFSMNKVWDELIKRKELNGVISKQKFYHINNYKIYKKISKKFID